MMISSIVKFALLVDLIWSGLSNGGIVPCSVVAVKRVLKSLLCLLTRTPVLNYDVENMFELEWRCSHVSYAGHAD